MLLTAYEDAMLRELHQNSRIPLWVYGSGGALQYRYFTKAPPRPAEAFYQYVNKVAAGQYQQPLALVYQGGELFCVFDFTRRGRPARFVCGPMLLPGTVVGGLSFLAAGTAGEAGEWAEALPVVTLPTLLSYLRLFLLVLRKSAPETDELLRCKPLPLGQTLRPVLIQELFESREEYREHTPYREELAVLNCVRAGDVAKLEATYRAQPRIKYGKMSQNPLRGLFYGSIANVTLITRYAIEGGLEEETAFTMSDLYIRRMERCATEQELDALNEEMAADFTTGVAQAKQAKHHPHTDPIEQCMDYITANLHKKITLHTLAAQVGLSPKYLSRRFAQQTGQSFSHYLTQKRVQEAKELLVYTRYSHSQICNCLAFSSDSHFIAVFRKATGLTPLQYRMRYAAVPAP